MRKFELDIEKLKEAICLVVASCKPSELGAVKLHKVLYYADMLTYISNGNPITGATYKKRPYGPTCDAMLWAVKELERQGAIEINETDFHGYRKKEFCGRRICNYSRLSEKEIETYKEVIDFVCRNNTAQTISDFSHDMVWDMVEFGEDIPYNAALNWIPTEVSKDALNWAEEVYQDVEKQETVRASDLESGRATPLRKFMAQIH